MINDALVSLTVPARAEFVDLVRLTLYGIAAKLDFSYEDIEDMKVAVSEACNNVVLHAYAEEPEGVVHIDFAATEHHLRISVRDNGRGGFQPTGEMQTSNLHGKSIEEIRSGGLGLYLMQALMDEVEVCQDLGTVVVLTKRRTAAKAQTL
ncbi:MULTISPECIES: anti-sigma B factor RsbW [Cohnella]|jgi:serine/threonine-protein kinase RsbW|uniref:anti-sigma B factor RsbW n=1 Tax=Cohnella TaxID=329857 RepID=UPI00035C7AAB|nr:MULTISPECIES: anti-sigma B factor RsbW [Cohnella]REK68365.1 MAG: anti-sigma B factor RsbW [Cohnella sp.]